MKDDTSSTVNRRSRQNRDRDRWADYLRQHPVEGIPSEEVAAHLLYMPDSYWRVVRESELVWALEIIHRFIAKSVAASGSRAPVAVDWRHYPERGVTKIMVCEWDRRGLLAHIAYAFSAVQLNVLRADAYTRGDQVAFDTFEVCEPGRNAVASGAKLRRLEAIIESRLSAAGRGDAVESAVPRQTLPQPVGMTPRIRFDNHSAEDHTILFVEASDRVGLLHQILEVLARCDLNLSRAIVETDGEVVRDQFLFTTAWGGKLMDSDTLRLLEHRLTRISQCAGEDMRPKGRGAGLIPPARQNTV